MLEPTHEYASVDELPLYPYTASIHYDGQDFFSTPHYDGYDELAHFAYDNESIMNAKSKGTKKGSKKSSHQPHEGAPFTRKEHSGEYKPRSSRHNGIDYMINETPMYVRPYLEDPIFLQPDDGEVALLHPKLAQADKSTKKAAQHDLQGDPTLEDPNQNLKQEHKNLLEHFQSNLAYTNGIHSNGLQNPNGYKHQGERCTQGYECISGNCMSWLNKAPVCMPF